MRSSSLRPCFLPQTNRKKRIRIHRNPFFPSFSPQAVEAPRHAHGTQGILKEWNFPGHLWDATLIPTAQAPGGDFLVEWLGWSLNHNIAYIYVSTLIYPNVLFIGIMNIGFRWISIDGDKLILMKTYFCWLRTGWTHYERLSPRRCAKVCWSCFQVVLCFDKSWEKAPDGHGVATEMYKCI